MCRCVCFITAGPITKLFAWGEEESVGGGGRAFYYTYIYSGKRESCEGAEQVGVLVQKPSCVFV